MVFSFTFQVKIHSKLKIQDYNLDCYIVLNFKVLLDLQANLPETSPFLSAQMTMLCKFFQGFVCSTWDV